MKWESRHQEALDILNPIGIITPFGFRVCMNCREILGDYDGPCFSCGWITFPFLLCGGI